MTNPGRGKKLIIGKELLPSPRDQQKQVRSIDGNLMGEHRKPKLAPHDVRDIKWLSLRETSLLTNEHHIHKVGMHFVLVTNAGKERVAEDVIHDVEEGVQHPCLLAIEKRLLNIVG